MAAIDISNCIETTANLVPVHIEYTGAANTKEFFTPTKIETDDSVTAYFRGLKLVGNKIKLNYDGYVIQKCKDNDDSLVPVDANYSTVKKFDSIVMFGHDSVDSSNQWINVNEWKQVSDILHSD